ncbi:hypothetical protein M501DRAFT_105476 [Patellaria atrata CBS 101060]|uniref:Uncharacterized protein n=1 Tax=Patellaria atrata CBS 101060 TaxID=1346257 RepID=A0A9P4SJS9_9PEZI|nr:hypothetical protein M501DRAFT_105476 [Patellaria atrata CBS 101060]
MARDYDPYSDYAESPAQSHRRSRRYRRADELDEPEVEDLRRAREDYYSIPSEERRRREPKSRMAQDEAGRPVTGTRTRNKASSGREHRRRRPEAEGTRQRSKDREVDEVVYVYNNADHEVEELPPVIIQRPTRSRTTPKSSRRVRAVEIRPSRSTRDVRREVGDSSDSRRKSRRDVTTIYVESPPEAVDLPKLSRYDAQFSIR